MPGWGAYVPEQEYKTHIANHVDEPEVTRSNQPNQTLDLALPNR